MQTLTPTNRDIQRFGWSLTIILPGLTWMIGDGHLSSIAIAATIGVAIGLCGTVAPAIIQPFYKLVQAIKRPVDWLIGQCALLIIFACVFLPLAIAMKILRRDELKQRFDRTSASYWEDLKQDESKDRFWRQW